MRAYIFAVALIAITSSAAAQEVGTKLFDVPINVNGQQQNLAVKVGDNVNDLAIAFCDSYGLARENGDAISREIMKQLQVFQEARTREAAAAEAEAQQRAQAQAQAEAKAQAEAAEAKRMSQQETERKLMFSLPVDAGARGKASIPIYEGDKPNEVARNFLERNNLPVGLTQALVDGIIELYTKYQASEREAALSATAASQATGGEDTVAAAVAEGVRRGEARVLQWLEGLNMAGIATMYRKQFA